VASERFAAPLAAVPYEEARFCAACAVSPVPLRIELLWSPGSVDLDLYVHRPGDPEPLVVYFNNRRGGEVAGSLDCDMPRDQGMAGCRGGMETFYVRRGGPASVEPYRFAVHHYRGEAEGAHLAWRLRITALGRQEILCEGAFDGRAASPPPESNAAYLRDGDGTRRAQNWSPVLKLILPLPPEEAVEVEGCVAPGAAASGRRGQGERSLAFASEGTLGGGW
jgi:hypothetical protein